MSRTSSFMIATALATLSLMPNCRADNGPTIRDCSLGQNTPFSSIDADFVLLSGETLKVRNGVLSVLPSQNELDLTVSESVDHLDNLGVDQLFATVSGPHGPTRSFFGTGTGFVTLAIPLNGAGVGDVFTISWHDTTDNGFRSCPNATAPFITPANTTQIPFVVTVVPSNSP